MVSKINSMKRIFLLAFGCAALTAVTISSGHGQNSSPEQTRTAIFAGGCFWCIKQDFDKAQGVIKKVDGYCGATETNTTNELVTSERANASETSEVTDDPANIS